MDRSALIVANWQYEDPLLRGLVAPSQDAESLGAVLRDPAIGNFEVTILANEPSYRISEQVESFFGDCERDDLRVFYFSGHGITDDDGQLYYAAPNTRHNRLRSTAVAASWVNDLMNQCRSRRQVMLLDCCHSGAFARTKAAGPVNVGKYFTGNNPEEGRGKFILTASDAFQYSFEGDAVEGTGVQSVFTEALVEGLRSGAADSDGDGQITLDELYSYVYKRVRERAAQQTPRKWASDVEGTFVIAANPIPLETPLPDDLQHLVDSPYFDIREKAIGHLEKLLRGRHRGLARTAWKTLLSMVNDDSRRVSSAAQKSLLDCSQQIAALSAPLDLPQVGPDLNPPSAPAGQAGRAKAEAKKLAPERSEIDRQAKAKAEADRLAREKAEAERLAEQRAEAERQAKAKAEAERIAHEKAEAERLARERAETERLAREMAEAERLARERSEAKRIAKARAEAERAARDKVEAEALAEERAEARRKARQKEDAERLARKAEAEKLADQRAEADRQAKAKADAERRKKEEAINIAQRRAADERLPGKTGGSERLAHQTTPAEHKTEADEVSLAAHSRRIVPRTFIIAAGIALAIVIWSITHWNSPKPSVENTAVSPPPETHEQSTQATPAGNSAAPEKAVSNSAKSDLPATTSTKADQPASTGPFEPVTFRLSVDLNRLTTPFAGCTKQGPDSQMCGAIIESLSGGTDWVLVDKTNNQMWLIFSRGEAPAYRGSDYFDDAFTQVVTSANSKKYLGYSDWRLPSVKDVRQMFGYWNSHHLNVNTGFERYFFGWQLSSIPTSDPCSGKTGAGFSSLHCDNQRAYCEDKSSGEGSGWWVNEVLVRATN